VAGLRNRLWVCSSREKLCPTTCPLRNSCLAVVLHCMRPPTGGPLTSVWQSLLAPRTDAFSWLCVILPSILVALSLRFGVLFSTVCRGLLSASSTRPLVCTSGLAAAESLSGQSARLTQLAVCSKNCAVASYLFQLLVLPRGIAIAGSLFYVSFVVFVLNDPPWWVSPACFGWWARCFSLVFLCSLPFLQATL